MPDAARIHSFRRPWLRLLAASLFALVLIVAPASARAAAQAPAAQEPANAVSNSPKQAPAYADPGGLPADETVGQTLREQVLSIAILAFGLIVLCVQYLLLRDDPHRPVQEILPLLSINLIITGTLFLISAGLSAQEIAPGLGLFGTIAGYVLGRRASEDAKARANPGGDAT